MARERGTFNFSASLEIKKEGALDARQVVQTKAELIQASTWLDDDDKIWLYNGLLVCVVADTDINNGVYFLTDKDNYTDSSNWIKIGSISGSTPDELLEAINNVLEEAKAYTDDKAGTVTFTGSNYITGSSDLTEAVVELDDLLKNVRDTYLPLSGGKMTGTIRIPYNGLQTNTNNSLIFFNETELWYGSLPYRAVFDTSNTDMIHRKNGINHIIYDESNFVAGTNYLAPGNVAIADISDLDSTWDSYLKVGVYDRNITVNGTAYPVMTDVSGATAINIYAPTTAGTSGQFLKSTGGTPSWNSITVADISNLNSTWDTFMTGSNLDTRNILINGGAWTVYSSVGTDTTRIYAPTTTGSTGQFLTSAGNGSTTPPTWANINLSDISGLQTDGDGSLYLANDGTYKEMSALSEQEIYTLVPSATANEANASVYTLVKNNSNVVVVYKDNGLFFPISWKSTTESAVFGSAVIYDFPIGAEGSELDNWIFYDIDLNSEGVCYCTQRSLTDSFKSVGVFSFQYSPDNAGAIFNEQIYPIIHNVVGYIAVSDVDESGNTITKHIGKITKTPDNITIVCTEGNTQITYVCTPDGNMTKQEDNITIDWSNIESKPSTFTPSTHTHTATEVTGLAEVATSGDYNDLSNKPAATTLSSLGVTATAAELNYVDGVTSNIQTQLNGKAASNHTHAMSSITDRGTITFTGAISGTYDGTNDISVNIPTAGGGVADSVDWSNVTNKPKWIGDTKPSYNYSEITGTIPIADIPTGTTGSTVALGNHTHSQYLTSIPSEYITQTELNNTLADYATTDDIPSLSGYATQSWVNSQGFIKSEYALPVATADTLGGIRVGAGLVINGSGVLSVTGGGTADAVDLDNITGMNSTWKTLLASAPTRYVTADPTWTQVTGKPTFATVATSGSYDDLTNKPTIPSLSGYATQTWVNGLIDAITPASIGAAASSHSHVFSNITFNNTGTSTQYLAGDGNFYTVGWNEIDSKPSSFTPSAHTHSASDITSGTLALARIPTGTTSSTVAIGNHTHSNYLTSSSLNGYATQSWVQSQGYITTAYTLPTASASTLGGIKVGAGLSISAAGVLSATGGGVADAVDWENITSKPDWVDSPTKPTYTWAEINGKPSSFTPSSHTHSASDITSGTLALARIPTGTSSSTVALGDHTHSTYVPTSRTVNGKVLSANISLTASDVEAAAITHIHSASDITSGILSISRIPTGTSSSTVALGNHTHSNYATTTEVNNLTYTDVGAASASHTHGTDDVTTLTGYTEGTSTSTLTSSMTLNAALASLLNQIQTKANSSHTHTINQITDMGTLTFTGAVTGSYDGSGNLTINIPESSSVDTSNFVTLNGTQTITGTKTFTQYTVFSAGAGTSSDKRLKRDIKPIENSFEILEGLTGYRYTLNSNNARSVGLIAQDVEKVLPEAVRTDNEGYKSVDTYPIVAVLVETIKELKKEIEELKSRL